MSKEAKLGLFVVAVFGVFLFFTVNMGKGLLSGQKRVFQVYFRSIGTLEKGAPVKQAGYDVGEVIGLAPKTIMEPTPTFYVVANINVNKDAHIAFDSKASIQTMGMMGEKYIEISYGEREEAPENSRIDGQGPEALDQVMGNANNLIQEIYKMVTALNVIFADQAFQKDITHLITNLEQFSREVNDLLGGQEERLKKILENVQVASAHLSSTLATAELFVVDARHLINENRPFLKKTLQNTSDITQNLRDEFPKITTQLTTVSDQLTTSMKSADQLIVKLDSMIDENRPDIKETMTSIKEFTQNAKSASDRVNHLIKQIDEGDGLVHDLIFYRELSQSAKQSLKHASDVLGAVSNVKDRFAWEIDTRYFPDRPRFDEDDNDMRVDFGVRFAATDHLSMYLGGNSQATANDLEAQMGYRVGPVTFHGGMIESEVGLGLDWQVFDRWMVGIEGVGLTHNGQERLDAYTEFLLWKQLYVVGGVQDLTDEVFPNVGVKLRF